MILKYIDSQIYFITTLTIMSFQASKAEIMKFYEDTNQFRTEHRDIYDKLLKKLNANTGQSFLNTTNLDDFMAQAFTDFNDFRTQVDSKKLEDSEITWVYDINKNEYVEGFHLPDKHIVKDNHFVTQLIGGHIVCSNNPTVRSYSTQNKKSLKQSYFNKLRTDYSIMESRDPQFKKNCSCSQYCSCNNKQADCDSHHSILETSNQSIWVDDYFNLYLPSIKTYLVFNYTKFPLYSFFINMNKLGLYHNMTNENGHIPIMFNSHCPTDNQEYTNFKEFVTGINAFKTSQDVRNKMKGLFKHILNFYQYDQKYTYFVQFQTLVDKFKMLSPSKVSTDISEGLTMNDEHKIYAQSQRIRELEIVNEKQVEELDNLRSERTKFIEKDTLNSKKIVDYQELLEELNGQLHDEIDKFSIQQKEIIQFKNKLIEYSELKHSYELVQKVLGSTKDKLETSNSSIIKLKTLNNTLVDKQMEATQKLTTNRQSNKEDKETIKQLSLEIVALNDKTKELDSVILIKDGQVEDNRKRMEELVSNMSESSETIQDDYQEMLLTQIKEKNEEIKQLKSNITKIEKESQKTIKQFNTMKSQVSSLINT